MDDHPIEQHKKFEEKKGHWSYHVQAILQQCEWIQKLGS
jgi:hypothetical protein